MESKSFWIDRDLSNSLNSNHEVIQIIRGPRQCGKTSLMLHHAEDFVEVSLDDPGLRHLAQTDPELFLGQFKNKKIFIDEAQYAPELFPSLKRMADLYKRANPSKRKTIIRLTGSNQILMDRNVKESLAGRASFFELNTLSVSEIRRYSPTPIQEILYQGGWPELYANPGVRKVEKFLDDFINSYVEKDVVLAAGIQKGKEFLLFLRLLAGRVGQLVDLTHLGNEAGVNNKTIKEWISVLERMHLIALVMPYSSNLSSRLIKTPKVYFLDTGLACRLQGQSGPSSMLTSPQQGPMFENLVFSELYKLSINYQLGWRIYFWRSKAGEEIDFLIQKSAHDYFFLEVKVSAQNLGDISKYPEIKKVFEKKIPPIYLCHQEGERVLGPNVPIAFLKEFLLK
ncbi:MAG: ATP-binding protein [Bacteriovoracaceae bacterium]|nr:ATP-binding protein [Bacteriovoracaceae bacterium]